MKRGISIYCRYTFFFAFVLKKYVLNVAYQPLIFPHHISISQTVTSKFFCYIKLLNSCDIEILKNSTILFRVFRWVILKSFLKSDRWFWLIIIKFYVKLLLSWTYSSKAIIRRIIKKNRITKKTTAGNKKMKKNSLTQQFEGRKGGGKSPTRCATVMPLEKWPKCGLFLTIKTLILLIVTWSTKRRLCVKKSFLPFFAIRIDFETLFQMVKTGKSELDFLSLKSSIKILALYSIF